MRGHRLLASLIILLSATLLDASDVKISQLLPVDIKLTDQPALQRGARVFMNYCSGCHSLRYLRFDRMAIDLGLVTVNGKPDEQLASNLIFTHAQINDPIKINMPPTEARQWFGTVPPDLSLIARVRSPSWLYTYLKSFYPDSSRPFGSNNVLIPDVAMPNVFAPLAEHTQAGGLSEDEFNGILQDVVTFLVYAGEPSKLVRYRMGVFVIVFLSVFLVVIYLLKKSYWRKVLVAGKKHIPL